MWFIRMQQKRNRLVPCCLLTGRWAECSLLGPPGTHPPNTTLRSLIPPKQLFAEGTHTICTQSVAVLKESSPFCHGENEICPLGGTVTQRTNLGEVSCSKLSHFFFFPPDPGQVRPVLLG